MSEGDVCNLGSKRSGVKWVCAQVASVLCARSGKAGCWLRVRDGTMMKVVSYEARFYFSKARFYSLCRFSTHSGRMGGFTTAKMQRTG